MSVYYRLRLDYFNVEHAETLPPSVSRLSRYCGTLNVSQPYGPPWPGTGIALPYMLKSEILWTIHFWN
jgi:hypothetical protein